MLVGRPGRADPLLRADFDRNGVMKEEDDHVVTAAAAQGAPVLANLDDDSERCSGTDEDGGSAR